MKVWRRYASFNDWLRRFSDQLRLAAAKLRPGAEQDAFVKQARVADTGGPRRTGQLPRGSPK